MPPPSSTTPSTSSPSWSSSYSLTLPSLAPMLAATTIWTQSLNSSSTSAGASIFWARGLEHLNTTILSIRFITKTEGTDIKGKVAGSSQDHKQVKMKRNQEWRFHEREQQSHSFPSTLLSPGPLRRSGQFWMPWRLERRNTRTRDFHDIRGILETF